MSKERPKATMLTLEETAERLGTTKRHVRNLTKQHGLPYYRIGQLIRVHPLDLSVWLQQQRVDDNALPQGATHE